jgi:flavin-dependent dehydrogenase
MREATDIAIVGGGPAGAALAIRLARAGIRTTLFERRAQPEWHACGVFSTPLTRARLAELGFTKSDIARLNRPIHALNLQTTRGVTCRIEYMRGYACGFDRVLLDGALLQQARAAGAEVRQSTVVRSVSLPVASNHPVWLTASPTDVRTKADTTRIQAKLVVGADGMASGIAKAGGVYETSPFLRRSGVTFHRRDPAAAPDGEPMEGRFVFGDDWYVGVAPVPGDRVNIGMVVSPEAIRKQTSEISERILGAIPEPRDPWIGAPTTDRVVFAGRLEHHVKRPSGLGFMLIGDAIEFIDPLTGEGLHRAFLSAEMAAEAIISLLRGDRTAMSVYDRRVRSRFQSKNVVSWVLQAFMARPKIFDYALRRLAARSALREELTLVLTDQVRASRVLDPRFLVRVLAP